MTEPPRNPISDTPQPVAPPPGAHQSDTPPPVPPALPPPAPFQPATSPVVRPGVPDRAPQLPPPPGLTYPPRPAGSAYPPPPPAILGSGPIRIEPVAGTDFGLAYARVAPVRSGPGIGSLIAGIGSILVTGLEICLGFAGAVRGWGALVAGAFGILAFLLGLGAVVLGVTAQRAIKRSNGAIEGRGVAYAGVVCGLVGAGLAVLGFFGSLIATLTS